MSTIEMFQPLVEPVEELMLHLESDPSHTLCGLTISPAHWVAWGAAYTRGDLPSAASGVICRICISRVDVGPAPLLG